MIRGEVRRRQVRASLSTSLVLAIAVMHILVVGCLAGGSAMPAMSEHSAASTDDHGRTMMIAATTTVTEHIAAATDCVMHDHGCVFVRADMAVLPVGLGMILAIAPLSTALGVRRRRRAVVLGRPPPWAILDHLQLSVIRR